MSTENNIMTTITKNPLVTALIFVVIIIMVIFIITKMRRSDNSDNSNNSDSHSKNNNNSNNSDNNTPKPTTKECFSTSDELENNENDIIENYPQNTPMSVMYSDTNGNLAATSDLGLQNLTVASDSSFGGNVGIAGSSKIGGFVDTPSLNRNDGDWLRINNQAASVGRTAMYGGICINDTRQSQGQSHGGLSVGDWNSNVGTGNIHATGRVFSDKNLQTIRNRVCFSNALDDPNHSIYNNGYNIDGEGAWDGMKMNVYAGLDVRTGNANGAVPKTLLSARDNTVTVNGNNYHIPLNVQSNTDSHIQLKTKNDDGKNVYLINRDGNFRVHHHGIGDSLEVNRDGNTVVNGKLFVGSRDILAELNRLNERFPDNSTLDLTGGRIVQGGDFFHLVGPKGDNRSRRGASAEFRSNWPGW